MNTYYLKTALFVFPHIEDIIEQIDNNILDKALNSMGDFSPCVAQCEKIVSLGNETIALLKLKEVIESAVERLNTYEKQCIDYRYFKKMDKDEYTLIETKKRQYYRDQATLIEKLSAHFDKRGYTDKWFESKYMKFGFFKEVLRCVIEKEKNQKDGRECSKIVKDRLVRLKKIAC